MFISVYVQFFYIGPTQMLISNLKLTGGNKTPLRLKNCVCGDEFVRGEKN